MNRAFSTISITHSVRSFIRATSPVATATPKAYVWSADGMGSLDANPDALAARCDAR